MTTRLSSFVVALLTTIVVFTTACDQGANPVAPSVPSAPVIPPPFEGTSFYVSTGAEQVEFRFDIDPGEGGQIDSGDAPKIRFWCSAPRDGLVNSYYLEGYFSNGRERMGSVSMAMFGVSNGRSVCYFPGNNGRSTSVAPFRPPSSVSVVPSIEIDVWLNDLSGSGNYPDGCSEPPCLNIGPPDHVVRKPVDWHFMP